MKVLVVVQAYPQISETYIKTEIEMLAEQHELEIVALSVANYPFRIRRPHIQMDIADPAHRKNVIAYLRGFAPDIIHGHYLMLAQPLSNLSKILGVPFTLRSHSFDVLGKTREELQASAHLINQESCLGMLAFPFHRQRLEQAGYRPEKIIDCYPVVKYDEFHDVSANGDAIMNMGAALPKKNMGDYIRLSTLLPEKIFNLYALGYITDELIAQNMAVGGRVNFVPPVEPDDMPAEYKKHQWLVYTASAAINNVGWPLAIAEAQAAGVGVCVQSIRPDFADYVGDAGFLFNSVEEAAEIIANPPPADMRERGFQQAKKSDIRSHLHLLTDLWR